MNEGSESASIEESLNNEISKSEPTRTENNPSFERSAKSRAALCTGLILNPFNYYRRYSSSSANTVVFPASDCPLERSSKGASGMEFEWT